MNAPQDPSPATWWQQIAATDAVPVIAGEDELITFANDSFLALIGYDRRDLEAEAVSWVELTPPEWGEVDRAALERMHSDGFSGAFRKEYRHRDGRLVPVMVAAMQVEAEPFRWISIVLDLSDEVAARERAEATASLWRAVSDEIPVGLAVFDRELRFVEINRELLRLNNRSADDHLHRRVTDVFEGPTGQLLASLLSEVWRSERRVDARRLTGVQPETGVELATMASYFPVRSSDGDITAVGCAVVDVSDQLTLERRLLREREQRQALIDGLFSFVGFLDPDGVLRDANRTALEAGGLAEQDVLGRPFDDTFWWSHDPAVQNRLRAAIERGQRGETSRYDEVVRLKGDRLVTIDFQLVPMLDGDDVIGMTVSGLDITDRIELHSQVEALAALGRELSSAATADQVAEVVVSSEARAATGAAFVNLGIIDDVHTGSIRMVQPGDLSADIAAQYARVSFDAPVVIAGAFRRRRFVGLTGPDDEGGDYAASWGDVVATGLCAVAGVPLWRPDRTVGGVLGLGWTSPVDFDDRGLRSRVNAVAEMVAQCLERTRISDVRAKLVRSLQTELLPDLPDLEGLEVAVRYRPATTELGFGGDWYELLRLSPNHVVAVVGDVVGHGVTAAAQMTRIRGVMNGILRTDVAQHYSLESLLATTSRVLCDHDVEFLGTAMIVMFDLEAGTLRAVSAGHPPALVHDGNNVSRLTATLLPPLGLPAGHATVHATPFSQGDVLVAYTDGLVENPNRPLEEGLEQLSSVIASESVRPVNIENLADTILRVMLPEADHQRDDVAIVVIRRTGDTSTARQS